MITYGSTTLTSYNTITKIEVYYYKSTSSTSLAGGSWSTTKPTWENGKYIWQKIRTTYEGKLENGLYYSESDPVNITGQQGQTGDSAYSYKLNASDTSITVSKDGTYSKTKVTFSATYKQGTGAVTAYAGRFKIETTANGTTWTTQYTSSANESSKEYTIPTGILNIRCSLYQAGGTSVLLDIVSVAIVTDGTDGTNGLNNARVILYRRFSAAPSGTDIAPTGNVTYTFSTGVAANNLNSWTQNIPTGTDPVYMIAASASNTGATDTIAKTEWSAPIKILENGQNGTNGTDGTNGIDGYNQATIYLYQRKSGTAPAKPSSAVTYTFSTGALSSTPSGWSRTIPANDGNPCYVTTATAIAKTATYSIAASAWSAVVVLSENGTSITITSTTVKYQKGTSGTTKPTGTWETSIPSIGENEFLWTQTIVNYSDGSKTEAYSVSRNAINGTSPTVSSTTVEYQQSTGGTTPPTGTWNTTAPSAIAGQYMWTKTTITYSDGKTAVSYSVSKNGANGIDGVDGTSQNLLLDVYATSLDNVKAPWERYLSDASNTTITGQFIAEDNLPDPNATHFYRITDSSASTKSRGLCFYNGGTPPFLDGHTYRIGCWVRNHAGSPSISFYLGGIGSWTNRKIITNTNWEWIECVHTFGDIDPTITAHGSTYKRLYFYFGNNNVEGSSLDMCGFKVEEVQTDISTARNYLLKTENLDGWGVTGGTTISNGVATFPEVTSNTWREIYPTKNFKYEIIRNKNIIFSVRVKADVGKMCACNLCIGVDSTETAYTRQKYTNNYVYFTGTGEWQTICVAIPISDEIFTSGSGTPNYDDCWVTVRVGAVSNYHNSFQATQPQLSLGTTATTWSAAPEDVEASMQEKVDNIEIGGRNLLQQKAISISHGGYAAYDLAIVEPLQADQPYTIQLWDVDVSHSGKTEAQLGVNVYYCGGSITFGGWNGTAYFTDGHADHLTLTFIPRESQVNHSSVIAATTKYIRLYNSPPSADGTKNMSVGKWKLEKGNKATDWSLALEDTDVNIGGRNLLYNSATMPAVSNGDKGWRASGGTVTHVDLTDPPIYNITGAIRVTNTDSTAKQIGMAQDRLQNKFIAGEKYTQSCWVRASDNLQAYMTLIWISNSQTTGTSFAALGQYYNISTDWTYIKIEGITLKGDQAASYSAGYVYALNVPTDGWIEVCGMKLEKGNKATDWTPAPEDMQTDIDTALAQSVEYIIGTQTATTNVWTGVTKDTSLQVGKTIVYYLPYGGTTSAATLNLTLAGGGTTGAKNVRWNNTNVTTHYPQYSIITLTYDGTYWRTSAYNSDTINRVRLQNDIIAAENITTGHIICGTSSGYQNIQNYIDFDLSVPILYAGTTIAKGATTGTRNNNFLAISGVNASTNGIIESGTIGKILYLKGTVSGNTFTISASPFMTTVVPTSADGFYYIPLGLMYSATAIYFNSSNRLYAYIDGAFQPVDTAAVLRAQDAKDRATAVYGTCSTGAGTAAKAVTCSNFVLFNGARIQVTFTNANTASAPTLNVNSTGAKAIYINKTVTSSSNLLFWIAGSKMEFVYDGTGWIAQNVPYALYGTCSTGASTAAKTVTCNEAVICKGTTISVNMTNTNTAANATLNVGSTVAKDIYANGAKLTVNSRFNWRANTVQKFVFDGQVWRMDDDSVKALATAYITEIDEDGIMVHPEDDNNSGWAISDAIQLFKNGISYIKLWIENNIPKIRIGKEDQGHIILDNDSVDVKNGDDILATFGETVQLGADESNHLEIDTTGIQGINEEGVNVFSVDMNGGVLETPKIIYSGAQGHIWTVAYEGVTHPTSTIKIPLSKYNIVPGSLMNFQFFDGFYEDDEAGRKYVYATFTYGNETIQTLSTSRVLYNAHYDAETDSLIIECSLVDPSMSIAYDDNFIIYCGTDYSTYTFIVYIPAPAYSLGTRMSELAKDIGAFSGICGEFLSAKRRDQFACGKYNEDSVDYAFMIGNGDKNTGGSNALAVTWDGNQLMALDTTASSGTTDADLYDAITALGWEDDVIK